MPIAMTDQRSGTYTLYIPVMFSDTDGNRHVNNKHYNSYCDEAMIRIYKLAGVDIVQFAAEGIGPVTLKAEYNYRTSLLYGDTARIVTVVSFPKRTRALFEHTITNSLTGKLVCESSSFGTWIDFKRKRPFLFPDEFFERMMLGDGVES